jgi:hypothetical protein
MSKTFISYSRRDVEFVRLLRKALEDAKEETWVDWSGIPPTAEFAREIERAIEAADNFVFVISPGRRLRVHLYRSGEQHCVGGNRGRRPDECDQRRYVLGVHALHPALRRSGDAIVNESFPCSVVQDQSRSNSSFPCDILRGQKIRLVGGICG